jgi:hypothetical protein
MAQYRIKAQKTGVRTYEKELQMISYRGSALFSDEGNTLISKKDVYYPPDYLSKGSVAVVADSDSYREDGLSTRNIYSKGRPAALPIVEQFAEQSAVSRSLLGIDRGESQQGLFDDVSSYGLDRKDWVVYAGYPDYGQGGNWENKNSPAGPHISVKDSDYSEGSSIVLTSYPVPYTNPGNPPVTNKILGVASNPGPGWGRYIQSLVAMYIVEYMVNNFSQEQKNQFRLNFLEKKYPKTSDGKFNRLYWDQIWLDINQGRFESAGNIPIIPQGTLVNFAPATGEDTINLPALFGANLPAEEANVSVNFNKFFFASTRYTWREPDQGHYRIATNSNPDLWSEYWGVDYNLLPTNLKNWEFQVYTSQSEVPQYVIDYKLPYFLITSLTPAQSLIFGQSWPQSFSDVTIPQISNTLADGNLIGGDESNYAVITLTSIRAFRYQPGRISGFTYGVRVSEEGAGPGSLLEWGVENYTDGYFFRLQDGTDFSVVRRSTVPLGQTDLFIEAGYKEREAYISQLTGVVKYKDLLSDSEVLQLDQGVRAGQVTKVYETTIQQNQMNGDGLNGQGDSGYIFNPDTVTMYKIEFGWYGAIGARFYMYIPSGNGGSRWVVVHTLVIENQIGQPCLEDPFFFFKYRAYVDSPSRIRLPQFVEKYGASYYIDGGDEGTVSLSSGKATNRTIPGISSDSVDVPIYDWASVLGLKPKQYIVNTEGNSFPNKKEVFPVSMSVTSTTDIEVKFVNQYGCRENAYTFQEGYTCILPEEQRLRGVFSINRLQKNESTLVALGRDKDSPVPTLTYVGPDAAFSVASDNLRNGGAFIGWGAYQNSLMGSHLIGDKVYASYVNPTQEHSGSPSGISGPEIVLQRDIGTGSYIGQTKDRAWSDAELLFRFNENVSLKLSRYRRDTTLLSTIDITTDEFYLLFNRITPQSADSYSLTCGASDADFGCDGNHFGEMQIGIIWPQENPGSYTYPNSIISRARVGSNFGIIDPKDSSDRTGLSSNSFDVRILEDSGNYYVVDKTVPNSANYRYYEGLPIDFDSNSIKDNVLAVNQSAWLNVGDGGLEVGEGLFNSVGLIDGQLPGVPGADGGSCHALYGKAGEIKELSTFTSVGVDGTSASGVYYLSKTSPWPQDLWAASNTIFVERDSDGASITVRTTAGTAQQSYTPAGTSVRLFLLPVVVVSGSAFSNDTQITAKYRAIALYVPDLLRQDAKLLTQKIVGQNLFPIRFFIRMREGAKIGGMTVGQVTPNGVIQTPFTPHGCTLSVSNTGGQADLHDGGSSDEETSARKTMIAYSHPGTLTSAEYSYYDASGFTGLDRRKKCPSFISNNILSGAGFSGVGDYPIRWLEFKESGDPIASFFVSANKPTEIDLSDIFNINTESVGPSFWSNKALFMIARNLSAGVNGTMSVTLNYKEQ